MSSRQQARTAADHHALDLLLADGTAACERLAAGAGSTSRFVGVLEAMAAHMDEHLDLEDAEILPLFERHYTGAEYEVLDHAAVEQVGLGAQAAFTIPFILSAGHAGGPGPHARRCAAPVASAAPSHA